MSEMPGPRLGRDDFERMRRVLDLSLTGHSILRDRFERRETLITLTIMALSILTVSLAFVSGESQVRFLGTEARLATWVGSLSAGIFFLALLEVLVDWKRSARAHEDSALRLSALKSMFLAATIDGELVNTGEIDLRGEYDETMASVTIIPESTFLGIKAKYRRKVAVSRLIDEFPGAPLLYVRLVALWRGMRRGTKIDGNQKPVQETRV